MSLDRLGRNEMLLPKINLRWMKFVFLSDFSNRLDAFD